MAVLMDAPFARPGLSKIPLVLASVFNAHRTQTLPEAAQRFLNAFASVGTREMGTNASSVVLVSTTIPVRNGVWLVEAVSLGSTFPTAKGIGKALAVLALQAPFRHPQA